MRELSSSKSFSSTIDIDNDNGHFKTLRRDLMKIPQFSLLESPMMAISFVSCTKFSVLLLQFFLLDPEKQEKRFIEIFLTRNQTTQHLGAIHSRRHCVFLHTPPPRLVKCHLKQLISNNNWRLKKKLFYQT